MKKEISLTDIVALTDDLPEQGLLRGQVGTVVEILGPGTYEVEFSDDTGKTYALTTLHEDQLLLLHMRPAKVA